MHSNRANIRYGTPGRAIIIPDNSMWDCTGGTTNDNDERIPCQFSCIKNVDYLSFSNTPELTILTWLADHKLMDVECNRSNCDGFCRPSALWDTVGLKCTAENCGFMSKGGRRGFWRYGRLPLVKTFAMVFCIVKGLSYKLAKAILGLKINKNTWTKYIKDIGMVLGEDLERNRRDDNNRYALAQVDETAFGKQVSLSILCNIM